MIKLVYKYIYKCYKNNKMSTFSKNTFFISNPTYEYKKYLIALNYNDIEILIKMENLETLQIYENAITEGNYLITSLSKFYIMLTHALELEKYYSITFDNKKYNNSI